MSMHHEWLALVEVSGPFLAIPVLKEAFPQGLEELDAGKRKRLRQAYDEWREALETDDPRFADLHAAWIDEVLKHTLELDANVLGDHSKLQVRIHGPEVDLDGEPAEEMVRLCRATGCRLGLVTNGERWMLVDAPVGAITTFASWYARIWAQEPVTLQAFVHLLGIRRFFVDEAERLPALFDRSLKFQDEVTDALGVQVRRAVEVLIQSLDNADQDRDRELLRDVKEAELYEAALTVMMRLVFLLSAEERGLLLLGDERYEANYALSTLRMQLRAESDEILERRWDAWSRMLAVFRAVYGGIEHENLRLPALGGSLFDPDRFPFLEGRAKGSNWRTDVAKPLPIDNRTVLLLLEAIQQFQGRTLSYRSLDVEQIGYVYEGLLERTVKRTVEVTLELDATKSAQSPWVTLAELESARLHSASRLAELLQQRSGSSASRVRNDLARTVDDALADRVLTACHGDTALRDRIRPFGHLVRTDPWGYPLVYPAGAFIVTTGSDRRETGTHYTPKSLTEAIVAETLTPIVYVGPAQGTPRAQWALKSPAELLDLKICDPAMGSGAFLVQACRWLADRLVESWAQAEVQGHTVGIDGRVMAADANVEALPRDTEVRTIVARRLIAERCLYGVDLNPLAVELAKLSIWLVTLAKGRPFGFLDHNLRQGDSLLGISRLDQLTELSLNPAATKQGRLFGKDVERAVAEAVELRRKLHEIPIRDIRDVEAMATLDADAREKLEAAELLADAFIGMVFAADGDDVETRIAALAAEADRVVKGEERATDTLVKRAAEDLAKDSPSGGARRPFHWPLEFPDVFHDASPGFDAIVGNPPFLGGQRITGVAGTAYRDWLVAHIAEGRRGSADLVAYFFLRAWSLLANGGCFGLLAVNTIAEGDTRKVGLEAMVTAGAVIHAAYPNEPWPGKAAVVTSRVHVRRGAWTGPRSIFDRPVQHISAFLFEQEQWSPKRLRANAGLTFQGTIVLGMGFVLTTDEAQAMIADDERNAEVVFPYVNGADLTTDPNQAPTRWVINFFDWPEERARTYRLPWQHIEDRVKPERQRRDEKGNFVLRKPLPERWWQFGEKRPGLYHAIGRGAAFEQHPKGWSPDSSPLKEVLASALVGKYFNPSVVSNTAVFGHKCAVFASLQANAQAALFNSSPVSAWVWQQSSRMKLDINFSPSDAVETFPFPPPEVLASFDKQGREYMQARREVMTDPASPIGLTKLYNRFHDAEDVDPRIVRLREVHCEIDATVMRAYGWDDLDLGHGYHEQPNLAEIDRVRFTISDAARAEVLRRFAELNRQRYEEARAAAPAAKPRASKRRAKAVPAGQGALALGDAPAMTSKTKAAARAKKASKRSSR